MFFQIRKSSRNFIQVLLAVAVLTQSCSKLNSADNGSGGNAQPAAPSVSPGEIQAIYPHSAEFKSTALHGQFYVKNAKTCKVCHGQDLSGAATKVSCASCHSIFPHSDDFKAKTHGSVFFKDRVSCARCHGADYRGGDIGVSCTTCHSYPHEGAWALPSNHGTEFVNELALTPKPGTPHVSCQTCHTASATDTTQRVTCDSCHLLIPHADDFVNGGHATAPDNMKTQCLTCHTNYTRLFVGPDGYSGCLDCHTGSLQTPVGWVTPTPSPSPSRHETDRDPATFHHNHKAFVDQITR